MVNKRRRGNGYSSRSFKKRRYTPRRRFKKATSYSFRNTGGVRFGNGNFRGRKLSRRAWKNSLFTHTRHLPHYRSIGAESYNLTSPVQEKNQYVSMLPCITNGVSYFWKVAGGLQPIDDLNTSDPYFTGDLVVRGGMMGIRITAAATNADAMQLKISLLRIPASTGIPSWTNPTSLGIAWDPTCEPDFHAKFGKVIYSTNKLLIPTDVFQLKWKIPVQKIDQEVFGDTGLYRWMVHSNSPAGVGENFKVVTDFNLSFTGDATVITEP